MNKVELDDELVSIDQYVLIDLAHAVMLTRTGIFDAQHGQNMVKTLLSLRAGDTASMVASKPEVGTLGLQIENYLEHELGPRGRDIQRARSRIDQKATNWRLINRASLTEVIQGLVALRSQILETAEHYADALMPGYTHLQHSQPTTIDHYLNAHYWAVSRNLSRLFEAYDRLNLSPLSLMTIILESLLLLSAPLSRTVKVQMRAVLRIGIKCPPKLVNYLAALLHRESIADSSQALPCGLR